MRIELLPSTFDDQGVATELFTAGDIELAETIEGRVNDASNPT